MRRVGTTYVVIFILCLCMSSRFLLPSDPVIDIVVKGDISPFQSRIEVTDVKSGIKDYNLLITSTKPAVPNSFSLVFRIPAVDICSLWKSDSGTSKFIYPNWSRSASVISRAAKNAPIISLLSFNDKNRLTFACSDALNTITMKAGYKEEDAYFDCAVVLFSEKSPPIKSYQITIRIDTRSVPFYEAIFGVSKWWENQEVHYPLPVPDHARLPMYSSWYSFHQNLVVDEVLKECRLAKKIGYHSVIIDDGWQTLDSNRGYSYTGDWKPERIPQMRNFVTKVHEIGMKFILWYSVPYIGDKSDNFKRFKGKYLNYWAGEWGGSYTLDPRYPDVREFLITTYENAIKEWDLDGFKLDFVDQFIAYKDTKLTIEEGRDFGSVNRAFDFLMTMITKRLRAIKPDILIEFRQPYIGPLMRKYGNMFRAGDCPGSYLYNRMRITDLRLLSGSTAVHSDMVTWHGNESVESAALQILNILFSVPQLSVRLDRLPQNHLDMISFWTGYWQNNRSILLDGKFMPQQPAANYPLIQAQKGEKAIIVLYDNQVVNLPGYCNEIDIVNGKLTQQVVIRSNKPLGEVQITITDCIGKALKRKDINLEAGIVDFQVPPCGLISIRKNEPLR